ncbi:MAG: hypothetical protein U1G07_05645 [Verrucomicrobiota bacterium]
MTSSVEALTSIKPDSTARIHAAFEARDWEWLSGVTSYVSMLQAATTEAHVQSAVISGRILLIKRSYERARVSV